MTARSTARRAALLAASALAATALAACGHKQANPTTADTEGQYVRAGDVTYQVQLSRQLNPYSTEDRSYFAGASATPVRPDQMWFGIFLWAKNESKHDLTTSASIDIVDTQGNTYYPVPLNASSN